MAAVSVVNKRKVSTQMETIVLEANLESFAKNIGIASIPCDAVYSSACILAGIKMA